MKITPVYQRWLEETLEQGRQKGCQKGRQKASRTRIESLLRVRFGELDAELAQVVERLMQMDQDECSRMILQLSQNELVSQLRS